MALTSAMRQALEDRGVDSVRALLSAHTGAGPRAAVTLDTNLWSDRHDVEEWLREKERTAAAWVKAGTIAAIASAFLALTAAVIALLAWLFPRV